MATTMGTVAPINLVSRTSPASQCAQSPLPVGLSGQKWRPVQRRLAARVSLGRNPATKIPSLSSPNRRSILSAASGDGTGVSTATTTSEPSALSSVKEAVEKKDAEALKVALNALKESGGAKLWDSVPNIMRRSVSVRELSMIGIKKPEALGEGSTQNDLAFLVTTTLVVSVLAVLAGQLPGDWGFFVPYLLGASVLVILAVGSVAPGLLQAVINQFSRVFPEYEERVLRHEAAHFLVAYSLGLPVLGYSLDIGQEHINVVEESVQKKLYKGEMDPTMLDRLAAISMAGLAAEGLAFEKVVGQSADLYTLQRIINRSKQKLSNQQQMNITRWATYYSCSLLKTNKKAYEALMAAMARQASVAECIEAIEGAA